MSEHPTEVKKGRPGSSTRRPATSVEVLELLVNRAERAVTKHPRSVYAYGQIAEAQRARNLLTEKQKREDLTLRLMKRLEDVSRWNRIADNPLGELQDRLQRAAARLEQEEDSALRRELLDILSGQS